MVAWVNEIGNLLRDTMDTQSNLALKLIQDGIIYYRWLRVLILNKDWPIVWIKCVEKERNLVDNFGNVKW